jgi:hypothetical protein
MIYAGILVNGLVLAYLIARPGRKGSDLIPVTVVLAYFAACLVILWTSQP